MSFVPLLLLLLLSPLTRPNDDSETGVLRDEVEYDELIQLSDEIEWSIWHTSSRRWPEPLSMMIETHDARP